MSLTTVLIFFVVLFAYYAGSRQRRMPETVIQIHGLPMFPGMMGEDDSWEDDEDCDCPSCQADRAERGRGLSGGLTPQEIRAFLGKR